MSRPGSLKVAVSVPGDVMRRTREHLGWTIEQFADYLGFEPHVYAGVEKGWRDLTKRQFAAFDARIEKLCEEYPSVVDDDSLSNK